MFKAVLSARDRHGKMDDTLQHLRQRFNVVMLTLVTLAFAASVVLIVHYHDVLQANQLATQKVDARRLSANIDSVLNAMASHVTRLHIVANDALAEVRGQDNTPLPIELKPFYVREQLAGYSLDQWHANKPQTQYGNLTTAKNQFTEAERDELQVMWRLLPSMHAMHVSEPALLWSYYQSLRFLAISVYPFEASAIEVERNGYTTFHDFITGYTTPQRIAHIHAQFANSNAPEWRGAHIDGGGGGWIASVTTPVRFNGELWAVVASDIKLQFLSDELRRNVPTGLRAIILDDHDQLLADTLSDQNGDNMPQLDDALKALLKRRVISDDWQSIDNHYVLTQPLSGAPWQVLVLREHGGTIWQEWGSIGALLLVSLIFIGGLIALSMWLRHFYVMPALRLAQQVMGEKRVEEQPFPDAWRPSAHKLNEVWQERELLLTALQREQQELEARVVARTEALTLLNKEMEAFSYAVSHDLRGPLRAVSGFVQALKEDYGQQLPDDAQHYIDRICSSVVRMEELIDGLLQLSRVGSGELHYQTVDLSALAHSIVQQLRDQEPGRVAQIDIDPQLTAIGDERLLRAVLDNLIGNAWKYSSHKSVTTIRFACEQQGKEKVYMVADKGAGFDMQYVHRLFVPFQRLHSASEFSGTGIGLATVQRIISRHGGRIWVDAKPGEGATFYFTLPKPNLREQIR